MTIYHGSWADNAGNEGEYATSCVDCVPACATELHTDEGCEVVTADGKGTEVYVGREGVYSTTLRGPSEAVVRECMEAARAVEFAERPSGVVIAGGNIYGGGGLIGGGGVEPQEDHGTPFVVHVFPEVRCLSCGESWGEDTPGYGDAATMLQVTGGKVCLSCEEQTEGREYFARFPHKRAWLDAALVREVS